MAKKQIRREDFDEAAILNLIAGVDAPPHFVPRTSPAAVPPEVSPPETPLPEVLAPETVATGKVPVSKEQATTCSEYEQLYLQPRKYDARITCRMDCDIRRKLRLMTQLLGDKGITVTCLMNNILYYHLQNHRAQINALIENSTKKIKL